MAVLASQVPEDEEPMNTTVAREVGSTQVITSEMDEAAFLRSQIVEIRRRKDGLYAERAEQANREVQIRLLLELVDEMAGKCFSPILSSRKVHLAFVAFELIFCYTLIVSLCLPGG